MDDITSLEGLVERVDGKLVSQIPLAHGGAAFVDCSRGIGHVEGKDDEIARAASGAAWEPVLRGFGSLP